MDKAKKYSNIKLSIGLSKSILTFVLLYLFLKLGFSAQLEQIISGYFSNQYIQFTIFMILLGTGFGILFYPINYFSSFYLEHKYNLSNQSFWAWTWENIKGSLVGAVIGIPIMILFYYVLLTFQTNWWFPFAIAMFIVSVVLAQIVPVVILPLFHKITPIENDKLKEKILNLSKTAGMKVENVFKFDMSKNTKKANAAFTGLGRTKRILLGDTLLDNYSEDEIETVLAHEFGHYKHKHIVKNILVSTISSFLTFYLMAIFYRFLLPHFAFESITTIAAIPILALCAMLLGVIQQPLMNKLSRFYEYQADKYAIETTNNPKAFIATLEKLTDQNLGDKTPHPLVEWFFYSHPSLKKRLAHIESIAPNN